MKTTAEILTWCVENNDADDFAIMVDFAGHVDLLGLRVYLGGFKSGHLVNFGLVFAASHEQLNELFNRIKTLKYYNDQSSQWADELAENKKQCEIAKLKLKLSELEG